MHNRRIKRSTIFILQFDSLLTSFGEILTCDFVYDNVTICPLRMIWKKSMLPTVNSSPSLNYGMMTWLAFVKKQNQVDNFNRLKYHHQHTETHWHPSHERSKSKKEKTHLFSLWGRLVKATDNIFKHITPLSLDLNGFVQSIKWSVMSCFWSLIKRFFLRWPGLSSSSFFNTVI